jgi:RimJ/RimL family protein N-acetyltransferase
VRPPALTPPRTARLVLRELAAADADALHRIYGDEEAARYLGAGGGARSREQTERTLESLLQHRRRHGFGLWAVEAEGAVVGVCGLMLVEGVGPDVELVYAFERPAWGKGYATEAAGACLEAGFGALGLDRIVALAYPENTASINVMRKLGMRPAGTAFVYGRRLVRYEARSDSA